MECVNQNCSYARPRFRFNMMMAVLQKRLLTNMSVMNMIYPCLFLNTAMVLVFFMPILSAC